MPSAGNRSGKELKRHALSGSIFEGFVASEIIKAQPHRGRRRELYYFRDEQGFEVDFLAPGRADWIELIEAKASVTVDDVDDFAGEKASNRLAPRLASPATDNPRARGFLCCLKHRGPIGDPAGSE